MFYPESGASRTTFSYSYLPQFIEPEQEDDEDEFEDPSDGEDHDVTNREIITNGRRYRLKDFGQSTPISMYIYYDPDSTNHFLLFSNDGDQTCNLQVDWRLHNLEIEDNNGSSRLKMELDP